MGILRTGHVLSGCQVSELSLLLMLDLVPHDVPMQANLEVQKAKAPSLPDINIVSSSSRKKPMLKCEVLEPISKYSYHVVSRGEKNDCKLTAVHLHEENLQTMTIKHLHFRIKTESYLGSSQS